MQKTTDLEALNAKRYLSTEEIASQLEGVEYIIMATPAPEQFKETPIHITIFLNTQEELPIGIKEAVFDKFCDEHRITRTDAVLSQMMPVGLAATAQETPMPLLLIKAEDVHAVPHTFLHVIDFLGDSTEFKEAKEDSLTGWSYSYE